MHECTESVCVCGEGEVEHVSGEGGGRGVVEVLDGGGRGVGELW